MKILICGYNLYGYLDSIAYGFRRNGCQVKVFSHPNVSIRKLKKGSIIKKAIARFRLKRINDALKNEALNFRPDLFLSINGSSILYETALFLSERFFTAIWLVDSLERVATEKRTIELFRKVFVFEPEDRNYIKDAEYLPYGFDERIYFRKDLRKVYDVTFVGAGHAERYEPLDCIARECKKRGIGFFVFGPFSKFRKEGSYRKRFPYLYSAIQHNGRLAPERICDIYNMSWININIHHPQSKKGVNPRVFEILGSGSFQITDEKETIKEMFRIGEEIETYSDVKDLMKKVSYYLDKKERIEEISKNGMKRAISEHTFFHRTKTLLERL